MKRPDLNFTNDAYSETVVSSESSSESSEEERAPQHCRVDVDAGVAAMPIGARGAASLAAALDALASGSVALPSVSNEPRRFAVRTDDGYAADKAAAAAALSAA